MRPPIQTSLLALLAANALPLLGVLFLDWQAGTVLLLYWLESAVVGIFTLARMATCRTESSGPGPAFVMPFFCVHFGMFMLVHLAFLTFLLGSEDVMDPRSSPLDRFQVLAEEAWGVGFLIAVLSLFGSHGTSFVVHYLRGGERDRMTLPEIMGSPYPRILVMHVVILFGAGVTVFLGQPAALVALLVVAKTLLDVRAHRRHHDKFANSRNAEPTPVQSP